MSDKYEVFRWDRVRGVCVTEPPASLPDYLAASMFNSELTGQQALLKKRWVTTALSLTSGPTAAIRYLYEFVTSAGVSELWAFSGNTGAMTAHRFVASAWSSVSLIDTPANTPGNTPHCATLNGKLFIAYDSSVNRLHLWDGTVVRRVGIGPDLAPAITDTGSGSYAATARYYKTQMLIKSGSDVIATSELSPASLQFTPSGTGVAARVDRQSTPDSSTHWRVYGSEDDITYYIISGDIVVATVTYDDSDDPADYSDGVVAPTAGLSVPPPSAKWLATDGNRLLMTGSWESTAATGQTSPRTSRVWFTAVLGARDNTGEDESIPQTLDQKNWNDYGEKDGDFGTGIIGPVQGLLYVFKQRSVWLLIPTGSPATPYRVERINTGLGISIQYRATLGEHSIGMPCCYFVDPVSGFYRASPSVGVEWLGKDIWTGAALGLAYLAWWPQRRQLLYTAGSAFMIVLSPDFMSRDEGYLRGGWAVYHLSLGTGGTAATVVNPMVVTQAETLYLGGAVSTTTAAICSAGTGTQDAGTVDVNPTVTSKAYLLAQNGRKKLSAENPIVETFQDQTTTVGYVVDYGTARSGSYSDQGGSGRTTQKIEDVWAVDGRALQIQVTLTDASAADVIESVTVPFKEAQAL